MLVLIDMDIVAYRCAASAELDTEEIAILRADRLMQEILYVTQSDSYLGFLSGDNNFRTQIYPDYKANRKDKPRPVHLHSVRGFLASEWKARFADGCEADDMLGVYQTSDTVICSIDKDLLQVPGKHYNFVKQEWYDITITKGYRNFYEQLLKGDKTDNIPGLAGIGNVKASKLLEGCETPLEMLQVCRDQYKDDDKMELYGKLLWIWRSVGDIWSLQNALNGTNQSQLEEEVQQESQPVSQMTRSSEPTTPENDGYQLYGL